MPFRCLFHVHTHCSFDSLLSPKKILAKARELRADALIITDHNTIQGSQEVRALAHAYPPLVILAAEYQSEKGDIIGLFLKEEIRSRSSVEIVQQIRAQGGLVVLPHPYKGHRLDDELLARVDLVESHNARCSENDNAQANRLARRLNLPTLAGADAHCSLELETAMNEFACDIPKTESQFRKQLLHAPRRIITQAAPIFCRPYSQMIKAVKMKDTRLFLYQAKRLALVLAQGEKS
jgi:predicted metal-dependent phosphoesterase TrpH